MNESIHSEKFQNSLAVCNKCQMDAFSSTFLYLFYLSFLHICIDTYRNIVYNTYPSIYTNISFLQYSLEMIFIITNAPNEVCLSYKLLLSSTITPVLMTELKLQWTLNISLCEIDNEWDFEIGIMKDHKHIFYFCFQFTF